MTREEAIKILKDLSDCSYIGSLASEDIEALKMAIQALEQEPIRPKGHWTDDGYCSCCNNQTLPLDISGYASGYNSFCPNCGADMRGEEE